MCNYFKSGSRLLGILLLSASSLLAMKDLPISHYVPVHVQNEGLTFSLGGRPYPIRFLSVATDKLLERQSCQQETALTYWEYNHSLLHNVKNCEK